MRAWLFGRRHEVGELRNSGSFGDLGFRIYITILWGLIWGLQFSQSDSKGLSLLCSVHGSLRLLLLRPLWVGFVVENIRDFSSCILIASQIVHISRSPRPCLHTGVSRTM